MNRADMSSRILELLSRGWDSSLSDEENQELNDLISRSGDDGIEATLSMSRIHLEVEALVASSRAYDRAMSQIYFRPTSELSDSGPQRPSETKTTWKRTRRIRLAGLSALAASLLAVVCARGLWSVDPVSKTASPPIATRPIATRLLRPTKPIGSLVAASGAVWMRGGELAIGQTLEEDQRVELRSGTAQISLACGADVLMQGPCAVSLEAHDAVRLDSGKVIAQVADWAKGFSVIANELEVTDLGTRFMVSAEGAGIVEAHVIEGSVLVDPLATRLPRQSSMLLESGQGVRVDRDRSKVDVIEAREGEFVEELLSFRPLRPIDIWNTGAGGPCGSADPYWSVTGGTKEVGPYPRPAIISEGPSWYEDNRPEVSQWLSIAPSVFPGVTPDSVHTFETTFNLAGYDLDTVYIVGYFLVDDAINELRINGHSVPFERWEATWEKFDFTSFHPIEIKDHFLPGKNTIAIDVYNAPSNPETPDDPNPTAIRVEWQAFGSFSK